MFWFSASAFFSHMQFAQKQNSCLCLFDGFFQKKKKKGRFSPLSLWEG
jgi:hypothetical protein